MRFNRLRLNGFKSFVDPTDLVIAEGLTGVVGPNGCGKSNLLEALRWVMGENRPTAMRGDGMEDVIFAGAATRPARNFAEVHVQIDNTDRLAPAGFNDTDQIDIVRRITRDAGSAYKLNGKDVRARDVQMLFADAATGAHSPALVRQGQISELINAKPKNRRRVLEDAAGIAGLYQRRHEAELKLRAAEQNLARVDDVLESLAGQLATLARQAKQAQRYRAIGEELRQAEGLLLWLRWRDADAGRLTAEEVLRGALSNAARAEAAAREATAARESAEAALPPLREEEAIAAALLQRLLVERDTLDAEAARAAEAVAGLEARIAQLSRDIERETALNADAGDTIAALAAEEAELTEAGQGHDDAVAEAEAQATAANDVLGEREGALAAETEAQADLSARHQAADRRIAEATRTRARHDEEAAKAAAAAREGVDRLSALTRDVDAASDRLAAATDLAARAEETLAETEAARAEAEAREAATRATRAEAEGRAGTLASEVTALARLLEREKGAKDAILDALKVDRGFEAALGAALSDDLNAPMAGAAGGTGWSALPPYDDTAPLPAGVSALGDHVTAPAALARRLSQIGLVEPADGPRLQPLLRPGQRLVSRAGDLWRWDGYAVAAADAVSGAARRLEQQNRLAELSAEAAAVEAEAAEARDAHQTWVKRLADLTEADRAARKARRDAETNLAETSRARTRAETERASLDSRLDALREAARRHEEQAEAARAEVTEAEAAKAMLEDLDAVRARLADTRTTVEAARMTMLARRAAHDELKREGEMRSRRLSRIVEEIATWRARLASAETQLGDLSRRKAEAEAELGEARAKPGEIATRRETLGEKVADAEKRRAAAADALAGGERTNSEAVAAERAAERAASEAREARAAAEARRDAAGEAVEAAAARIVEELEQEPETLRESLGDLADPLPRAEAVEAEVHRLRRQRDALGAVNLRAEEDAKEVEAEHSNLAREKEDLEAAIAKLRSGIASLNREGRARLLTAFEQVNTNFAKLFTHLFGGGEARLVLVESDDPLEAGLEILCQPPGKKLSTLSLLSGGEQTLTALALIFAVFLANPAPICVLDEVDAPLDDANVGRFCDLLDEMTRQTDTRFLIITHHAVTMARMDRLFGVTMAEQGVSQLVSVDLKKAEQMVA
ncbi:chromosome segregation protein SMC [Roseibacterium sp. SDUM158016]|uniref:chromosome segregation protein SMC n=1 Tax=Roseicyclus sediminis TaxID=2980997 RepID=UPI0021D2D6B1|nr:chromosome segregation protein SMC [Roseibacterium sp. SDUM158016]MCU4652167.1 chromosome segregation protein SMC [Roseibacterium sp. SDUM158016]